MDHPPCPAPAPGATLSAPGKDLTFLPAPDDRLRFREDVGPDADPVPPHRHLRQFERFTIIAGVLTLTVAGEARHLTVGESLEVAPGVLHTYAPGGAGAALIEVELWPALDGHRFFETVYGFAREGRLPPAGPRDAIALMALAHTHAFVLGSGPVWAMRGLAAASAGLAAILRVESWVPRFAGRAPAAPPPVLFLPAPGEVP